ncbi:MAG: hypothetical protein WC947_05725 [Elusimicrobiota bacterium]
MIHFVRKTGIAFRVLVIACHLSFVTSAYAAIMTNFADLVLENLQIGESYNLKTLKNCPMTIINNGSETIDVNIVVEIPQKGSLMPGYEAILDESWVQVVPSRYRLGPREKGSSAVIIIIPNDEKLVGRHFQTNILTSSLPIGLPSAQLTIATGTQTRFRFSVGSMAPETFLAEKKRKKMMTLNFELDPVNITVKNAVKLGKKINLRTEQGIRLTLINRSTEPVPLSMQAVVDKSALSTDKEYEIGNPKFLTIKPKKLKLDGESMEKLDLYLKIPDEEQYKNKKFVFLIQAQVLADVPVEVFSKLYITTGE